MRYLKIAEQARGHINKITNVLTNPDLSAEAKQEYIDRELPSDLMYLYNLGIRTAPRGVQSTVRIRAIETAGKDQPVKASLKPVTKQFGGRTISYKALRLESTNTDFKFDDVNDDGED